MKGDNVIKDRMNTENNIDKVLVSVIIPTFRQTRYLERALISLTDQTHESLEIIIVDDNDDLYWSEKVLKIIHKSKDSRIIYLKNDRNLGSAQSRNVGIEASNGSYVSFLDDDDVYEKNKIKLQLSKMIETNADFSLTNMVIINKDEKILRYRNRKQIKKYSNILEYHLLHHLTGTSTIMFLRDFLFKVNSFDLIDIGDEYYLILKSIINQGKFTHINEVLVKATIHDGGEGLSLSNKKITGEKALFENKKKFFKDLSFPNRQYIKMRHYLVNARYYLANKKIFKTIYFLILSFVNNPIGFLKIILSGDE